MDKLGILSRRLFLGRAALAPAVATTLMEQVAKRASFAREVPTAVGYATVDNGAPSGMREAERAAMSAARKAIRAIDRRSDIESLVWLDSMRSWSSATKVRVMREWRTEVRAQKSIYEKILGYDTDD